MKDATNLHVPMPGKLHQELRLAAATLGRPATVIAREAIVLYLKQLQREATDKAITEWAEKMAGSEFDLDEELEQAGVDFLLAENQRA